MNPFAQVTPKRQSTATTFRDFPPSLSFSPRKRELPVFEVTSTPQAPSFPSFQLNPSFQPQSLSSSIYATPIAEVPPSFSNHFQTQNDSLAELSLVSNRRFINTALSRGTFSGGVALFFGLAPLVFHSSLHWILQWSFWSLAIISFLSALLNFFEYFYTKYIKPHKWERVKSAVSQMDPRQRVLMGVENDIAQLVDAVSPIPELKKAPSKKPPKAMDTSLYAGKDQRRIAFRSLKPTAPIPFCYPKTSDVRNVNANFALRQPAREPHFLDEAARPSVPTLVRPTFQTYQLSSMPTPEEQIIAGPFQLKYMGPLDTLREFQVHEDDINLWNENLREWLARKVFHPLVAEMNKVELYLERKGWSHLTLYNDVPAVDATPSFPSAATSVFGNLMTNALAAGKTPLSLSGLAAADPSEPLVKSRIQLERFLFMSSYPVTIRHYLIRRILELSEGSHLAAYRWDSGSSEDHHLWTSNLPTDAELVLHVFCTWMDIQMPGASRGLTAYSPFTVKYFRPIDDKSDIPDFLHIQMSALRPPHFRLCQKRTIYDIFPKRNNLFSTLCLFTYNVQKDFSGYIDMLDISGNVVGLTSILNGEYS